MTLTEVLMALMVMGIGVVSVITLFPISLLRSIEATNLTNATLLRENAEARLESSVSFDPNTPGYPIPYGILQDPDQDGQVREHDGEKFIFDPLGAWIMASDGTAGFLPPQPPVPPSTVTLPSNATMFGNVDGDLDVDEFDVFIDRDRDGAFDTGIKRYTFGIGTGSATPDAIQAASDFVTLPDSFITIFEGIAGSFTAAPGSPTVQLVEPLLGEYVGQEIRVSAFDSGSRSSSVLQGTVTANNVVTLGPPGTVIPPNLTVVDRIIVDMPERRYTWIATVRRSGSSPSVSIATFFRRSFAPEDEKAFALLELPGSHNVFILPWATIPGSYLRAGVPVPPANGISLDAITGAYIDAPPGFEKGGWMFDLNTFRWWKIVDIQEYDLDNDGTDDSFRFATDPEDYDSYDHLRAPVRAIFPRNVVEVYTLKKDH